MNGARSTFMRKGYLLTALAAVVLLAASPGTAAAQNTTGVTITGPSMNTVTEGGTATYTVTVRGYVDAAADGNGDGNIDPTEVVGAATFNVTLGTEAAVAAPDGDPVGTTGEAVDLNNNLHVRSVTFNTPRNASTRPLLFTDSKTISVVTLHDNDAEDEHFTLAFALSADGGLDQGADNDDPIALADVATTPALARYNPVALIIDDDEMQSYTLTLSQSPTPPKEGTPFMVDLKASPAHVNGTASIQVNIDKRSGWTLAVAGETTPTDDTDSTEGPTTVDAANGTRAITITQTAGDRNRVTDTVIVSAHTGRTGASQQQDSLSIDVADANLLPAVTAMVVGADGMALDPQPTYIEEGKSVDVKVMVVDKDGKPADAVEALEIELSASGSADARDYELSKQTLDITSGGNASMAVTVTAEMDEDVGMETLVLDATVSGDPANGTETSTSPGVLTLDIMDATEKKIAPKATDVAYPAITGAIEAGAGDEGLNPGEMVEIMTDDLFDVMDGYSASYGASVDSDAVSVSASGNMVTINALKAGTAHVTITGTARAASSLMPSQTVSNVAELTFPVEVVDMPLMITLEMPDNVMDGNIVEGMSYEIGVMANRMITEAESSVEVMIMRDRSQSDADDSDFTVGSATIMAGYDSATAELMVTDDMEPDGGTNDNMGEQLVLYGMAGDMETNALTFTIWDAAVPALPLIAQILLALFLALGGARLYRRRQG